jgi:outer membrane immunogenic protein
MNRAVTIVSGVAFILAASGSAFAAGRVPPPPPAPVFSWTGWYAGGNVGYGWGDASTDLSGSINTTSFAPPTQVTNASGFSTSHSQPLQGVIGGVQIGYNYQIIPRWVLGFETDIQASGERSRRTFAEAFTGSVCTASVGPPATCTAFAPATGNLTTLYDAKIDWFGTARGRVGYLANNELLVYATGGLAYGQVSLTGVTNIANFSFGGFPPFAPGNAGFGASKTNVGWTAGAGIEGRLFAWLPTGWTWKLEYLYVDLGLDTVTPGSTSPFGSILAGAFRSSLGTITTHTHFTDNIVRVGLNYQFH